MFFKMDQCSIYGLDTEFIKVDTLWPKLGVCQVNVNGDVYLLDGVSLDLSQFWKKNISRSAEHFSCMRGRH